MEFPLESSGIPMKFPLESSGIPLESSTDPVELCPPNRRGGGDILFLVRIPSEYALLRFRALSFEPMDGF